MEKRAGRFQVDLFASETNPSVKAFFSKMPSDHAMGRDAFPANWGQLGLIFAHPVPKDVLATVKKFVRDGAKGGLIIPRWFSLYGWELIVEDGVHLNRLVSSVRFAFPKLTKGEHVKSEVFSGFTSFPFLSMEINGSVSRPFEPRIKRSFCVRHGCEMCS